jgi:hypothetical protein
MKEEFAVEEINTEAGLAVGLAKPWNLSVPGKI